MRIQILLNIYSFSYPELLGFVPSRRDSGDSRFLLDADWSKRSRMRDFYCEVLDPDWLNLLHAQKVFRLKRFAHRDS
jgi:hypothetical protein